MGKVKCKPTQLTCSWCHEPFITIEKNQVDYWKECGKAYCSPDHSAAAKSHNLSIATSKMSTAQRQSISSHMKRNNPMAKKSIRDKVSSTLKAIGWKPVKKGGNGRGLTEPQKRLADALGWSVEFPVRTNDQTGQYPVFYKVDIANPQLMIAIEVDGNSHSALQRKQQDRKKEAFLSGRGWTVLRFKNKEVMNDLDRCVQTVMSTILK